MKYKIVFPQSCKKWTEDIEKVKSYAKVLEKECPALYAQAKIHIMDGVIKINSLKNFIESSVTLN